MEDQNSTAPANPGTSSPKRGLWIGITVAVIVVALIGMTILLKKDASAPSTTSDCSDQVGKSEVVMTYTASQAFDPACVKVSVGTTIKYQNQSDTQLEVGANPHPVHSGNREVSGGEFVLEVPQGGSATAKVEKTGTFGLHNHAHSSSTATIIVQ